MEHKGFACFYCDVETQYAFEAIGHSIVCHGDKCLSIKEKVKGVNGKSGSIAKHYFIVPNAVKSEGKTIWISAATSDIKILKRVKCLSDENEDGNNLCNDAVQDRMGTHALNIFDILDKIPNSQNQRDNFELFLKLVLKENFPLDNIAFLLFLDVAKWFSEQNAASMRYYDVTKNFWRLGFRLFHGKFLNFMKGLGNQTLVRDNIDVKGHLKPENAKLNFAVPCKQNLIALSDSLPNKIYPGVITSMIEFISKTEHAGDKTWKVCVDLKKINESRGVESSPVDLWGHEDKPSKTEKEADMEQDIAVVKELLEKTQALNELGTATLVFIRENKLYKNDLKNKLLETMQLLCKRLKSLRLCLLCKQQGLNKLKMKAEKEGFSDWKQSKYSYAISATKTNIALIKECIDGMMNVIDKLCQFCSVLNDSERNFRSDTMVTMSKQENLKCLGMISENEFTEITSRTKFIKQRSDDWFNIRSQAKVTASELHHALGLGTLRQQQDHYDKVILGKKMTEKIVTKQMEHGKNNEINAVATICGKILPTLYPTTIFKEVGCYVKWKEVKPFVVASPDGEGDEGQTKRFLFEIKCPYASEWKAPVHYNIPEYYVPQILCQMGTSIETLGYHVKESLFVSWSMESTTAFHVKFDGLLWGMMEREIEALYGHSNKARPTKKRPESKVIKEKIASFLSNNVSFLGEFKSLKAIPCNDENHETSSGMYYSHRMDIQIRSNIDLREVQLYAEETERLVKEHFKLDTERPSDIIVFMLSDLDRTFDPQKPYVYPVAYGYSSKTLKVETVRNMLDYLRRELVSYDINVQVEAFDGQFIKLAIDGKDGSSLTLLQERKKHWKEVCKITVNDLARPYLEVGKLPCVVRTFDDACKHLKVSVMNLTSYNEKITHGPIHVSGVLQHCYEEICTDMAINLFREALTVKLQSQELESARTNDIDTNSEQHDIEFLTKNASIRRQATWKLMDLSTFKKCFETHDVINKNFTKNELQSSYKVFVPRDSAKSHSLNISSKSNKHSYVDFFAKAAACSFKLSPARPRSKQRNPKKLKQIIMDKFRTIKKETLNVIAAHVRWTERSKNWNDNNCSPIQMGELKNLGFQSNYDWFSTPDKTEDKLLVRFLDHHHLLTNCRIHCCKKGYKEMDINPSAWYKVAVASKENGSGLNVAFVEDLVDTQSNSIAQLTFSTKVEEIMTKNNDIHEANFCKLIREWYEAVDEKGIKAKDRVIRLLNLREFLLDKCSTSLNRFPPPGSHISSMPSGLFSGLLISCERLIQLYRISKSGTYNVRSIGSLDNETFFSSFRDLDPRGAGVLRTTEIPKAMSIACEILTTRLNPDRLVL